MVGWYAQIACNSWRTFRNLLYGVRCRLKIPGKVGNTNLGTYCQVIRLQIRILFSQSTCNYLDNFKVINNNFNVFKPVTLSL